MTAKSTTQLRQNAGAKNVMSGQRSATSHRNVRGPLDSSIRATKSAPLFATIVALPRTTAASFTPNALLI
jgi:hypothetical protein